MTLPLWGGASARAAGDDDDSAEGEDEGDEDGADKEDALRSTSGSVLVEDHRRSAMQDARRQPESAFFVAIDEAVPPTSSVADVLEDVPGASIRRSGGPLDSSVVSLRGASARQVAVFLDGIPLNSHGSAEVDLSELPLGAFDRIDVYRGFAPAHLGGFAIGGAVDLVTDPHRVPPPRLEVSYGSWQTRRVAMTAARKADLPGGVGLLRAHVTYTGTRGDFRTFSNNGTLYNASDDGFVRRGNNHRDQVNGWLSFAAALGRASLRLLVVPTISLGGEPGAWYAQSREARSRTVQNLLHGRARLDLGPGVELLGGLGWRVRADLYQDLLGEIGVGTQDQRNHWHALEGDLSLRLLPTPWLTLRPSLRGELLTHQGRELRPHFIAPLHRRLATQVAIDARLRPRDAIDLRAALGLLVVADHTAGDEAAPVLLDLLPGLAIAARPLPALTLRSALARSVRAPTFLELFGDRGSVVGNPSLRPERAVQIDGGANLQLDAPRIRGALELGGFLRDTRDLIVLVPNSARVGVPQNLARALVGGLESYGELAAGPFQGRLGLTVTGSRILSGERGTVGNRVPQVPLWQVDASLAFVLEGRLRIQWSFTGIGGTFDSPSNFFEQAPRPLHDLHLRVQPHPRGPYLALDLRNLFDTLTALQPRNPLAPSPDDRVQVPLQDFRGQPLPGRSVMVTLGFSPGAPK